MHHHSINKLYFLLVCSCISITAIAQKLPPHFKHYDVRNGLSSNIVTCIYKDTKGYLWAGTNDGLNKFNGTSFEVYRKEDNDNPNSIGGNFIRTIFEDSQQRIWVSSDNGKLSCLQNPFYTGHEFLNFDLSEYFPSNDVVGVSAYFFEDKEANLFVFGERGVLFKFNSTQKNFVPIIKTTGDGNSPISGSYLGMNKNLNELYIIRNDDSVFGLNTKSLQSRFIHTDALQLFLKTNPNARKFIQRTGLQKTILWLVSGSGHLISYDVMNGKTSDEVRIPEKYGTLHTYIRSVGKNNIGQICIGINYGGILLYDQLKKEFSHLTIPFELANENRLAEIFNFFVDDIGVFWISTRSGIYQQSPSLNMFENYSIKKRNKNYNYIINITSFYKNGNKLWIGTENNTLVYDLESNTISESDVSKDSKILSISNFFTDNNNHPCISTHGVQLWNPATKRISDIECRGDSNSISAFRKLRCHTIFRDTVQGDVIWWFSGWHNTGIFSYNVRTKVTRLLLKGGDKKFPPVSFRGIEKDRFGRIWAGTQGNGLVRLDNYQGNTYTQYKNIIGDSTSLAGNVIMDLCKDNNGDIWVITGSNGVTKLDFKNDGEPIFKTYSRNAGLHHLALYDGLMDKNNNIWMSSSGGIEKFSIKTLRFTHYGYNNGIFNSQLATGKYIDDGGYFYLSSWFTFVRFHPDSIKDNLSVPAINISHLQVMNRDSSQILLHDGIELPYSKNSLAFTLEAINLIDAHANRYRYMMVGIDKEWIYAENRNYASYPDIPPGKYTFRFTASNKEGIWNEKPATFSFTILPPWYQAWWFYSLLVFVIASTLYALFKYRLTQKLHVLQIRNRLHRDLHDDVGATLSSVKAYSEILKDNPNNPVIAELIRDNSTEMIERLEVIAWATNPQHDHLKSLKSKMIKFATPLCHSKNIECNIENSGVNEEMMMPGEVRQNIFLVFKEAINNMIKYAEATTCTTQLFIRSNKFVLQITDNGKGFDGTTKGTGSGWKNMQKRTNDLNGKLIIDSTHGKGTAITMSLPYPFKIPSSWDAKRNGD